MKFIFHSTLFLFLLISFASFGQYKSSPADEAALLAFEKKIDDAVVTADLNFLRNAYADDFRFKHGTGHVDDKTSWLKDVEKSKGLILSRVLDSVEVEIHHNVGVTNGKLTVTRKDKTYALKYVRVYVMKEGQWQMIMHRTVEVVR